MKFNTQHLYSKLKEFVSEFDRMPSIRELQKYIWYKSTRSISLIYAELIELWMLERKWTKYYLTWMEEEELVSKKQIKEILLKYIECEENFIKLPWIWSWKRYHEVRKQIYKDITITLLNL